MLRVHRQRLAWRDAEEARVELGRLSQEPALAHVAPPRPTRHRVVERLDVPTAVGGESRDRVDSGVDEPPQVLGRGDPTGEPTAHADDGDRLVQFDRQCRLPLRPLPRTNQPDTDVFGEDIRGRVVEDQRGR